MYFYIFLAILSFSFFAHAQTVEKVMGSEAMIHIQGSESLSIGDKVQFLDDQLNASGQGEVTKISEGGKKALVNITSGKASAGMSLEKNSAAGSAKKIVATEPERPSSIGSEALSDEDRKILRDGEISPTAHIVGGVLATYPIGLGIGHAVQGRYTEKGWIFTVGELASMSVMIAGLGDCVESYSYSSGTRSYSCGSGGMLLLGALSYIGFRIWESIDAWVGPFEINRRHRRLKMRMEPRVKFEGLALAPTDDGALLGMKLTF